MIIDELRKMNTINHEVNDYDESTKILIGKLTFSTEFNVKEYMRWICYYFFDIGKANYSGQKRLNDATYNILFKLIDEEFRPNMVFLSDEDESKYELEYDICLSGVDDVKYAIDKLYQEKMLKDRQLYVSREEKDAISVVIDVLNIMEYLKKIYETDKVADHLKRLEIMAKNAKK